MLDKAVERFRNLQKDTDKDGMEDGDDKAEFWKSKVHAFQNLYVFLSQVIPYQDSDLEKLYTYLRYLILKLPKRKGISYQFDEDVKLDYYRLEKISEGSISLSEDKAIPLDGPTESGSGSIRDTEIPFSKLIDMLNEAFGSNLNSSDQLFFDQLVETALEDDVLRQAAESNSLDRFLMVFGTTLEKIIIDRMGLNESLFNMYMGSQEMQEIVSSQLGEQVYKRLTTGGNK